MGERVSGRTGWQRIARRIRVPMGFVFAVVFLWLARPSWRTLALSVLLVAPGVWLRGYASGYVKKNAELATTGPYAHTRNPLYLGSMLIAFGFAAAAGSWVILILLAALFAAIYIPTILSEEAYLREHFVEFAAYAEAVPRLLPRLTAVRMGEDVPAAIGDHVPGAKAPNGGGGRMSGLKPGPISGTSALPAGSPEAGGGLKPGPISEASAMATGAGARTGTGTATGFSGALYGKHREYNCAVGVGAIYGALILRLLVWRHL